MTPFAYIFISFVLMTGCSVFGARLAYQGFQSGYTRESRITAVLAVLSALAASYNLYQLMSM